MRALNISDSGLAGVTGFGILQEIFKATYQRPLIVNKETQAEPKSWLRERISTGAARISWESAKDLWRTAVG
jgi:ABC-type multidrug transport system permease subunit